ncbi:Malignant T-cell-amplified sequence 1 [Bonamia ostreae]|uniref:Malignant T-cell-amplified sequence 1 n=1 Tax=Bonamia ostreae TaxID=126728 RepID=A0ABV2APK9_9EUKA
MPALKVDEGAIKHVLRGSDIMTPGLTNEGGEIAVDLEENKYCVVNAEGKEHAAAVGMTLMSTEQMRKDGKGRAIKSLHHLGDSLWELDLSN